MGEMVMELKLATAYATDLYNNKVGNGSAAGVVPAEAYYYSLPYGSVAGRLEYDKTFGESLSSAAVCTPGGLYFFYYFYFFHECFV